MVSDRRPLSLLAAGLTACLGTTSPDTAGESAQDSAPLDSIPVDSEESGDSPDSADPRGPHPCNGPVELLYQQAPVGEPAAGTPRFGRNVNTTKDERLAEDFTVPLGDGCWCVTQWVWHGRASGDWSSAAFVTHHDPLGEAGRHELYGSFENQDWALGTRTTLTPGTPPALDRLTLDYRDGLYPGVQTRSTWTRPINQGTPDASFHVAPASDSATTAPAWVRQGVAPCADWSPWPDCSTAPNPARDLAFEVWGVRGGDRCEPWRGQWFEAGYDE